MNANFRNFALWVIIGLVLIALFPAIVLTLPNYLF